MNFEHYISLGYFCTPALELERFGLRDCSSPFDWCISEWGGVEEAIRNGFADYLVFSDFAQDSKCRKYYKNMRYGLTYFHDFDAFRPLSEQFDAFSEKYKRRIDRFMKNICDPTLFVRYISTEKGRDELSYLENNVDDIKALLKSFNDCNEIVFIVNKGFNPSLPLCFEVSVDDGDVVSRKPADVNADFSNFLKKCECYNKENNFLHYVEKKKNENRLDVKLHTLMNCIRRPYKHNRVY